MVKRYDMESYTKHFYEDSIEIYRMKERDCGEYVKFEDYAALAAQVEALRREFQDARKTLQIIASCGADSTDSEIVDVVLDESRRWVSRYDESVLKLTPQQHLAEVKAQAGRAGFIAGSEQTAQFITGEIGYVLPLLEARASQYADKIRQGE